MKGSFEKGWVAALFCFFKYGWNDETNSKGTDEIWNVCSTDYKKLHRNGKDKMKTVCM